MTQTDPTRIKHDVHVKVAIVGGGPAGLSAARILGKQLGSDVLVIERESDLGGIPRHADHPGYGIRDRKSFMSGPAYARVLAREARDAGVSIWTNAQVTHWADRGVLNVTTRSGIARVYADAIVLATGARERPRSARMVWGDRPVGVYTTGQLQQLVHLNHDTVGRKAVIVGAELVSWSAALTLKKSGCRIQALISRFPASESYALFRRVGSIFFGTSVVKESTVVAVYGKSRVEAVEIENIRTGERRRIPCDTVIFSGDWIPDYELAWQAGVKIDDVTGSPIVTNTMMTSQPGLFSVGNLNHPVETADVVALEGREVAQRVLEYLAGKLSSGNSIKVSAGGALTWIYPHMYQPTGPRITRRKLIGWVNRFISFPTVEVRQSGVLLASARLPWPAAPGRVFRIPDKVLRHVRADRGEISVTVR